MPFAQHFPASEFQAVSDRTLGATQLVYAAQLSNRLELIRHALGDQPLVLSSYVRTAAETDTGNPSQHRDGTAVDVRRPSWLTWGKLVETVQALQHTGLTYGQFIIYPWETPKEHFHLSLPTGTRRQELLVKVSPGRYESYSAELAATFPGATPVVGAEEPTTVTLGLEYGRKRDVTPLIAVAGGLAAVAALAALRGEERT